MIRCIFNKLNSKLASTMYMGSTGAAETLREQSSSERHESSQRRSAFWRGAHHQPGERQHPRTQQQVSADRDFLTGAFHCRLPTRRNLLGLLASSLIRSWSTLRSDWSLLLLRRRRRYCCVHCLCCLCVHCLCCVPVDHARRWLRIEFRPGRPGRCRTITVSENDPSEH